MYFRQDSNLKSRLPSPKVSVLTTYWTKKETHVNFNGQFNQFENCCLPWVESAICRDHHLLNKSLFWYFALCFKCSNVSDSWDKPCASCTTLHLRDMNGIELVIITCRMPSQTSWITRHNCSSVCGDRSLIWRSVRSRADIRWGTGRWVCWQGNIWTTFDLLKSFVGQIEKRNALFCWNLSPSP